MNSGEIFLIALAGLFAGALNTAAGGGTLVSYPILLIAGMPPVTANMTSAVGLIPGYIGGAVAYRRELEPLRPRLRSYLFVGICGGLTGAVLLLITPATAFERLAPYLVLGGSVLFLLQPIISSKTSRPEIAISAGPDTRTLIGIGLTSAYGSYFSAGVGVMYLAVLGLLTTMKLQQANAIKNLLSLAAVGAGALVYSWSNQVHWNAAAILLVTSLLGGYLGGRVARRVSSALLRIVIGTTGMVVGVALLVST